MYFQPSGTIGKLIYHINTIEGVHRQIGKVTKIRDAFTSYMDHLPKLIYLATQNIQKKNVQATMTDVDIHYRIAIESDIHGMASLRAEQWGEGTEDFWAKRISGYMRGDVNPQQSLATRNVYVAIKDEKVVGFIAGHLTRRFDCDGELEWINVAREHRGVGISSKLLHQLAAWFISQEAMYICVNCAPDNAIGQKFYKRNGAENLNEHWLIWKDISTLLS